MAQIGRPGLSPGQKSEVWRRWRSGESLSDIGRAIMKHPASVFGVLKLHGGITPPERTRASCTLSFEEREGISRELAKGSSMRQIARMLERHPSTISREINRNGGIARYRAILADENAWHLARRPKQCKLTENGRLRRLVASKLGQEWSPEQISGWLKVQFPGDNEMNVSHEAIYRSLFIQARGALKEELKQHLRTKRKFRQSRHQNLEGLPRGRIIDAVSISDRPPEAEDRAIPGHWEGDLIAGSNNSHIATLVERRSRFTILVKVDGKDTESVVRALTKQVKRLPSELRRSLTWDRGSELANHKEFTISTDVKVYFCDPSSPWQRGTNENTNNLLRQYFPKGSDLSVHSQSKLNTVANRLNRRPRKTLGFNTPAIKLHEHVASTA